MPGYHLGSIETRHNDSSQPTATARRLMQQCLATVDRYTWSVRDSALKANRRGLKRATVLFARAGTRNTDRSRKSLSHSFSSCLSRESKFCETMRRRFKGQRFIIKTTTWTNDANKNKTNIQRDNKALTVRISAKPNRGLVE